MKNKKSNQYESVVDMLRGIGMDSDFVEDFVRQVESDDMQDLFSESASRNDPSRVKDLRYDAATERVGA
jgi:hypothetical protein